MTAPFIMVAPNGARRMKTDHPELPITMQETVETAISCQNAGADALHLHIRDQQGQHSLDAGSYREALTELTRQVPNLRIQITTEAMGQFSVEDQFECLKNVQPEWASISIREIARSPDLAGKIYAACADQNTEVQHILYDTADVALFNNWRADDTIKTHQTSAIFVLGRYAQNQISRASDLKPFLDAMPTRTDWMVCAFGPYEHDCLATAWASGGACRVGFENSLTQSDGRLWDDNAATVRALRQRLTLDNKAI